MKKVKKYIKEYIKNHPYDNGGAIRHPKIKWNIYDDGDIYLKIKLPYVPYNKTWFNSIFNWIEEFRKTSKLKPDAIYLHENVIQIVINLHTCNPD